MRRHENFEFRSKKNLINKYFLRPLCSLAPAPRNSFQYVRWDILKQQFISGEVNIWFHLRPGTESNPPPPPPPLLLDLHCGKYVLLRPRTSNSDYLSYCALDRVAFLVGYIGTRYNLFGSGSIKTRGSGSYSRSGLFYLAI